MFKQRLISGIILVVIAFITLYVGGNLTFAITLALSLIGLFELYRVFKIQNTKLGMIGYITTIAYYSLLFFHQEKYVVGFIILFLVVLMGVYVFSFPRYNIQQIALTFLPVIYAGIMMSYIYQVRSLEYGGILIFLVFLSAWGNDTCAYCVGVLFGKHKMTPKLSPKKTIEGAIGGIVGAGLLGLLYSFILYQYFALPNNMILYSMICIFGAIVSIIGDLAASAIKRNQNIKDYGNLIPGHGGIMDRFDSIIFTAPIIYYMIIIFQNIY